MQKTSIEVTCDQCGKIFERQPNWVAKTTFHFCNRACHTEWQRQSMPRRQEHVLYKSVTVPCETCGAPLKRAPYRLERYKHHFCNNTCIGEWRSKNRFGSAHPRWKGGDLGKYGTNWIGQKSKARKRDNYCCQSCGIHESKLPHRLDVHHIIPFRTFGKERYKEANQLGNLVSLCRSCHIHIEQGNRQLQLSLL